MKNLAVVLLLGLLGACHTSAPNPKSETPTPAVVVANPMPAFSLAKPEGGTMSSTEVSGKPLLINFWSPT